MSLLHSPLSWIGLALVLAGTILICLQRRSSRRWGFKDVVKDPSRWRAMAELWDGSDRNAEAAKSWDDRRVGEAVREFIFDVKTARDAWPQARLLHGLGRRTHAPILALLADPSLAERWIKPTGVDLLPETPFKRACDLLREDPPIEVIPLLAPFLSNTDSKIRNSAALILAETGATTAIPHVRTALKDPEPYVRSYAMMGLTSAAEDRRLDQAEAVSLFDDVARLLGDTESARDAAKLLCTLDRKRALELMASNRYLVSEAPTLAAILDVLADQKAPVERMMLLPLIDSLESVSEHDSRRFALGDALRLLGHQRDRRDQARLEAALDHPNSRIADDAASGLLAIYGLEDYEKRIHEAYRDDRETALSEPQRWSEAVSMCNSEVCNGGLSQYFFNSSGNDWQLALRGLEAIGSREYLSLLREALAAFGHNGPSTDRDTRQDQLSRIVRKNDKVFEHLETRWYKHPESLSALTAKYVIAHPEAFR